MKAIGNKGQVALEFLMTYGWALLLILVAISTLAYFGILNLDIFIPARCSLPSGLSCLSYVATSEDVTLVIQNSLGQDILVTQVVLDTCSNNTAVTILNGNKHTFEISECNNGQQGQRLRTDINITYRDEEIIYHNRFGELVTTVE